MSKIRLVRNDTRPILKCTITDSATGGPIDITGAQLRMYFRELGADEIQATIVGVVVDGPAGECLFSPASNPVMLQGEEGAYEAEIEVTFLDGTVQTAYDVVKFKVRDDF